MRRKSLWRGRSVVASHSWGWGVKDRHGYRGGAVSPQSTCVRLSFTALSAMFPPGRVTPHGVFLHVEDSFLVSRLDLFWFPLFCLLQLFLFSFAHLFFPDSSFLG